MLQIIPYQNTAVRQLQKQDSLETFFNVTATLVLSTACGKK